MITKGVPHTFTGDVLLAVAAAHRKGQQRFKGFIDADNLSVKVPTDYIVLAILPASGRMVNHGRIGSGPLISANMFGYCPVDPRIAKQLFPSEVNNIIEGAWKDHPNAAMEDDGQFMMMGLGQRLDGQQLPTTLFLPPVRGYEAGKMRQSVTLKHLEFIGDHSLVQTLRRAHGFLPWGKEVECKNVWQRWMVDYVLDLRNVWSDEVEEELDNQLACSVSAETAEPSLCYGKQVEYLPDSLDDMVEPDTSLPSIDLSFPDRSISCAIQCGGDLRASSGSEMPLSVATDGDERMTQEDETGAAGDGETGQTLNGEQPENSASNSADALSKLSKAQKQRLIAKARKKERAEPAAKTAKKGEPNGPTNMAKVHKRQLEQEKEDEDAGYIRMKRSKVREESGVLVTGHERTCLQDAVANAKPSLAKEFGVTIDEEELKLFDKTKNTRFVDIHNYLNKFSLDLVRSSQDFMECGGPAANLLKERQGLFIVQLSIRADINDKDPDIHSVFYNARGINQISSLSQSILVCCSSAVLVILVHCRWCDPRQLTVLNACQT